MEQDRIETQGLNSEIEILRLEKGPLEQYRLKPNKPHRNAYQAIIWIRKGSGSHLIDDQHIKVEPNTFMLVSMNQVHAFNPGVDTEGWAVRFSDSFLNSDSYQKAYRYSLFDVISSGSLLHVGAEERVGFETLMEQMNVEYDKRGEPGRDLVIQRLLEVLIVKLDRLKRAQFEKQASSFGSSYDTFQRFSMALENHLHDLHDVSGYANLLGTSARNLSQTVKGFLGEPASRVIQKRLVIEAKRYLRYTGLSIKEISFELGFSDPSYFSRMFRKIEGVAPGAFRSAVRESA